MNLPDKAPPELKQLIEDTAHRLAELDNPEVPTVMATMTLVLHLCGVVVASGSMTACELGALIEGYVGPMCSCENEKPDGETCH